MPCRRSMIPGSRMQLWTFLADRTYQRDIKPVPTLSCGGVFRYRSGERLHGMQEVTGSIPVISTRKKSTAQECVVLFLYPFRLCPKASPWGSWQSRKALTEGVTLNSCWTFAESYGIMFSAIAGIVHRLVYQPSKLRRWVRFPLPAPQDLNLERFGSFLFVPCRPAILPTGGGNATIEP